MNYKITWQKPNGDTIERILTNNPYYQVGYVNSYNWQVVDIKREHNNNWIDVTEYNRQLHRSLTRQTRLTSIKRTLKEYQFYLILILLYILSKCL